MSLNETVSSERVHIGFFGCRNAGKSSLVNAVCNQQLSIVSDIKGTTTDPVKKSMELLPLGPVLIIDTPGLDDEGELGKKRIEKTNDILKSCDIAVLCIDSAAGPSEDDNDLIKRLEELKIPYITAYTKADLLGDVKGINKAGNVIPHNDNLNTDFSLKDPSNGSSHNKPSGKNSILVSALTGCNIDALKEKLALIKGSVSKNKPIVSDLLSKGDLTILVIPIDESAPKGRLILPQQLVMRDLLDAGLMFMTCQPSELKDALASLTKKPSLVITDSQAFKKVSGIVPDDILLTSFSILFARYRGDLGHLYEGASLLKNLKNDSKVLISEACTHHRQCNDIGSVKIPGWIKEYTGACPEFEFSSGNEFPKDLSKYDLIIHCGGCMINEKEMKNRLSKAVEAGVPIVNYGMAIAEFNGILKRSMEPFQNENN